MKYYDKLIFEISRPGRVGYSLPKNEWKVSKKNCPSETGGRAKCSDSEMERRGYEFTSIPANLLRDTPAELPEAKPGDLKIEN